MAGNTLYAVLVSEDVEWLSIPEFADRLGIPAAQVRDKIRDRKILAIRRGEQQAWALPAGFITIGDGGPHVIATLRGTFTLLADAGFSDDEAMAWMLAEHEELGMSPLASLREGRRSHVRRLAQALL
ncbi:MAG: transcriptional regulator [Actinobacteria bacterium HGW-Actinobacteria-4]|nr:MAG: transcriptional regulator [Actinobacteria bacterium HGW-Actinobacteria-4]